MSYTTNTPNAAPARPYSNGNGVHELAQKRPAATIRPQTQPMKQTDPSKEVALVLSELLADMYILRLKTQQVHWNVEGPLFTTIHKMTEEFYESLAGNIDELAERIRAKHFYVPASFSKYEELSVFQFEKEALPVDQMLSNQVRDNEILAKRLSDAIERAEEHGDHVTADMLTSFLATHEEKAWMFVSLMNGKSEHL